MSLYLFGLAGPQIKRLSGSVTRGLGHSGELCGSSSFCTLPNNLRPTVRDAEAGIEHPLKVLKINNHN